MSAKKTTIAVTLPPGPLVRAAAPTAGELFVTVLAPSHSYSVPLPASGELRVGRGEECDVRVDDPRVSRVHVVLHVDGSVSVVDQGSSNGTQVGDELLAPREARPLAIGQPVVIGNTTLIVARASLPPPALGALASGPFAPRVDGLMALMPHARGAPSSPPALLSEQSRALAKLMPTVRRIAAGQIAVLLLGETGVGKEVMARQIHELSPRRGAPMVSINCSALSSTLLESELFGHEKGAFTGAASAKQGLLEVAQGGTVFLDEVGELPLDLQAKLLRALEEHEVLRVGALRPRPIDVRFVSATNRDLQVEIDAGRFRRDLFYRLGGVALEIPPLRDRRDEIRPLAEWFVRSRASRPSVPPTISNDALEALEAYPWPGNIRELRNTIERALLLCSGGRITAEDLLIPARRSRPSEASVEVPAGGTAGVTAGVTVVAPPRAAPCEAASGDERARIVEALEACQWNQTRAAERLGISRRTLVTRLSTLDLPRPRKRP
jgi:DNA-binding NtrC family response regulator